MPAKVPNLVVPAGKKLTLDLDPKYQQGARIVYLRPRTTRALKTVAGLRVERPDRLDDRKAFEVIQTDAARSKLYHLSGLPQTRLGELDAPLFRAIVGSLDAKGPIPGTLRLQQRFRPRADALREALGPERPDPDRVRELGRIIKTHRFLVPQWLRDFHIFIATLTFGDIVIEAGATLTISKTIVALQANSLLMHEGAKVVQLTPYLTATITGDLKKV